MPFRSPTHRSVDISLSVGLSARVIIFFFNLKDVRFHLISFFLFPPFFLCFSLILQVNPRDNRMLFEVFDENRLVSTGVRH